MSKISIYILFMYVDNRSIPNNHPTELELCYIGRDRGRKRRERGRGGRWGKEEEEE